MANRIEAQNRGRHRLQFEVNDLTGGFVTQAATYNIEDKYLDDILNMEIVQGMWQKRKGYTYSGSFTPVTNTPGKSKGMHVFNQREHLHVLSAYGTALYDTYQLSQTDGGKRIYNNLPPSGRIRFADFEGDCYIAHGKGSILKFNGKSVTETFSPSGDVLAVYGNRLLVGGLISDPMTFYYSAKGDASSWSALNYITLDGGSGERITAMVPLLGKLFIFTNRSIYSLVGDLEAFAVSQEVHGIGAVSAEALYVYGSVFYFISEDQKIYEFDGGNYPTEISRHISHYIKSEFTQNATKNAVITHYKDSIWFTFDNSYVPKDRVTLVYFPEYGAWSKYKGIPAADYVHINGTLYFTGSHNYGSLYQFGTQYKDDLAPIEGIIKTTKWSLEALENIKRFKNLYIRGAIQGGGSNGFDLEFYVDDSLTASVRVTSDIASETEIWNEYKWGEMYWGFAANSSGVIWGQTKWDEFEWGRSEIKFAPKWGYSVWEAFNWGDHKEGTLSDDVGSIYRKLYLSQYNIISGKTLQIVIKDKSPDHGFRFENLLLEYIQKGAR
ncbi:hypothetical protein DCC39_10240 [Pueribacillus theae]|uniref:Uncharacterized protein n=1 Tax=Pueribacillus theae TaxID=2171751 RepID=A0A2U1K276_9BACI|nr:hypothetical protein [Pueribacillus theae]PWA11068.1 hypothetical protein DCC39_10240 [Pueribacillus theae]